MSSETKLYIALVVSLVILELSTLLSTAYVDNKKYSINSIRLTQYDRNWWSKLY